MHLRKGHEKAVVLCPYKTITVSYWLHCHSGVKTTNQTQHQNPFFTLNTITFFFFFNFAGFFYSPRALKAHVKFKKTIKLNCTYS